MEALPDSVCRRLPEATTEDAEPMTGTKNISGLSRPETNSSSASIRASVSVWPRATP